MNGSNKNTGPYFSKIKNLTLNIIGKRDHTRFEFDFDFDFERFPENSERDDKTDANISRKNDDIVFLG